MVKSRELKVKHREVANLEEDAAESIQPTRGAARELSIAA